MKRYIVLGAVATLLIGCSDIRRVDYSVSTLMATLQDKDPNMRYWAVQSLGHFGREAKPAVPALIDALRDEETMVRMGAAYALAEIGAEAKVALPSLREATKDRENAVRKAAAYAIKKLQGRR
jgi:HEAT repeat protein